MTLTPEKRRILEDMRRKYNVHFDPELPPRHLHQAHVTTFKDIGRLREIKFADYGVNDGSEHQPWKKSTKIAARRIACEALKCIHGKEPNWRLAIEHLVFSRFA